MSSTVPSVDLWLHWGVGGEGDNSPNALTAWKMKILRIDLYGLVRSVKTTAMTALLLK